MFPEYSRLETVKLWFQDIQKYILKIRTRMDMSVWKDDAFLDEWITKTETLITQVLSSSSTEEVERAIKVFKEYLNQIDNAIREGVYDSRSMIGDYTLDMQAIIQEIDRDENFNQKYS